MEPAMPTTAAQVDPKRLAKITRLDSGAHAKFAAGVCIMEAAAYVSRLPFSDHPECASPVISAFMRSWNDALPDSERTALLLPLLPKIINTRGSDALERRRSLMAADWLVRVNTPAWLRLAGLTVHADALAGLPEITSMEHVLSIRGPIEAARLDAAATWVAAGAAARDAAWAAARAAAEAAAVQKLAATKTELQQSVIAIVERMCAATEG